MVENEAWFVIVFSLQATALNMHICSSPEVNRTVRTMGLTLSYEGSSPRLPCLLTRGLTTNWVQETKTIFQEKKTIHPGFLITLK